MERIDAHNTSINQTKAHRIVWAFLAFWVGLFYAMSAPAPQSITATAHGGKYPEYPKIDYGTGEKAKLIQRGEYLAKMGDCIACHTDTKNNGKPFAGGLPIETPYGELVSPNITPDQETGIGGWSEEAFIRAMRDGISPQGQPYFPALPYVHFTRATKEDWRAIKAYLDALEPVHNKVEVNHLNWPFRIRFLQRFWQLFFFDFYQGEFKPDPSKSKTWNRGAYIVEGLGHCAMCHSPRNLFGAIKRPYALTGGFVQGFYAPNISAANLEGLPHSRIEDVFTKDQLIVKGKRGSLAEPMREVNHDSLQYLNDDDLHAIATYLLSVQRPIPEVPTRHPKYNLEKGELIYDKHCAVCHNTGALQAPIFRNEADWDPLIRQGKNELYKNALLGIGRMPPRGACNVCSKADIFSAVDYIVRHSSGEALKYRAPKPGRPEQLTALRIGKRIYNKHCAQCHDPNVKGHPKAPKVSNTLFWQKWLKEKGMRTLINNTIKGYGAMPPKDEYCPKCRDSDIVAAVKYLLQKATPGDYRKWT